MDDFLHNLRSGKLKQPDRGRRDYADYKGPQRRAGSDRRKTDYYAKVTSENFALVKDSLDLLADNQRRIADAMETKNKLDSRVALALEAIVEMLSSKWGYAPRQSAGSDDAASTDAKAGDGKDTAGGSMLGQIAGKGNGRLEDDQIAELINAISTLRGDGNSWEKIARELDESGVPTVSGKGRWRGTAVKKLWDANSTRTRA